MYYLQMTDTNDVKLIMHSLNINTNVKGIHIYLVRVTNKSHSVFAYNQIIGEIRYGYSGYVKCIVKLTSYSSCVKIYLCYVFKHIFYIYIYIVGK